VTNVWETRHRLLLERLDTLACQLREDQLTAPTAFNEQAIRLLTGEVMLLRRHHVNKRGQCKYCRRTRWAWLFQRRSQCSVYFCLDFAMCQPVQIVWRRLHEEREGQ
jgi:hypothetical protein